MIFQILQIIILYTTILQIKSHPTYNHVQHIDNKVLTENSDDVVSN